MRYPVPVPFRLALLCVLLHGCATPPPPSTYEALRQSALRQATEAAQRHAAQGMLRDALRQWEIAAALAPGDGAVAENVRRLQARIAVTARAHREKGEALAADGRWRLARTEFLRALSLDPGDTLSRKRLRSLEQRQAERQLAAKVERSRIRLARSHANKNAPAEPEYPDPNGHAQSEGKTGAPPPITADAASPTDRVIDRLRDLLQRQPENFAVRRTLIGLYLQEADKGFNDGRYKAALEALTNAVELAEGLADQQGEIEARRVAYAERLYSLGVRLARAQPEQAQRYWRLTLGFKPDHRKAELRLQRDAQL